MVVPNWFLCTDAVNYDKRNVLCSCRIPPNNVSLMPECVGKGAPPIPFYRLLGRSGFSNAVGCVKAAASDDIQEIVSMGGCFMWNNEVVCGGRVRLIFFVRVWLDMCKFL